MESREILFNAKMGENKARLQVRSSRERITVTEKVGADCLFLYKTVRRISSG